MTVAETVKSVKHRHDATHECAAFKDCACTCDRDDRIVAGVEAAIMSAIANNRGTSSDRESDHWDAIEAFVAASST